MRVRPIHHADPADLAFVREELTRNWHDVGIWSIGRRYQADELPALVAIDEDDQQRVGLVHGAAGGVAELRGADAFNFHHGVEFRSINHQSSDECKCREFSSSGLHS